VDISLLLLYTKGNILLGMGKRKLKPNAILIEVVHDGKPIMKIIKPMSPSDVTLEQDFHKSLDRAKNQLLRNEEYQHLFKLLVKERERESKRFIRENDEMITKLAQLGIVNMHIDNTISLSRIGKKLAKIILS